ncbi:MAG: hypothetical protein ACPGUV_15110, partial [Polyangiales bacterium]
GGCRMVRRSTKTSWVVWSALWGMLACGGASQDKVVQNGDITPQSKPRVGADGRILAPREMHEEETFADLVAHAQQLEAQRLDDSDAGCVFSPRAPGPKALRFTADVATAVQPLPAPPQGLATRLQAQLGAIRVVTRWGQVGEGEPDLAVATFTSTARPLDGYAVVVFLTPEGVYLRHTRGSVAAAHAGPFAADQVQAHLEAVRPNAMSQIVVTADAQVPMRTLMNFFHKLAIMVRGPLDSSSAVALGVVMPPDAKLPSEDEAMQAAKATGERTGLCMRGLPQPEAGSRPGKLDSTAMLEALEPLKGHADRCVQEGGEGAGVGGQMNLALRVDGQGKLKHACFTFDQIKDPGLRQCLLGAVQDLRFPRPKPAGLVDATLPLYIPADPSFAQRPVCRE